VTPAERRAVNRGATAAVLNCGCWPTTGTIDEYEIAVDRAYRETGRAVACWQRWRRRYDPDPHSLEVGSGRTNTRFEVARAFLQQRADVLQTLTGPAAGSA
jgi:hypothetical protein